MKLRNTAIALGVGAATAAGLPLLKVDKTSCYWIERCCGWFVQESPALVKMRNDLTRKNGISSRAKKKQFLGRRHGPRQTCPANLHSPAAT